MIFFNRHFTENCQQKRSRFLPYQTIVYTVQLCEYSRFIGKDGLMVLLNIRQTKKIIISFYVKQKFPMYYSLFELATL